MTTEKAGEQKRKVGVCLYLSIFQLSHYYYINFEVVDFPYLAGKK